MKEDENCFLYGIKWSEHKWYIAADEEKMKKNYIP